MEIVHTVWHGDCPSWFRKFKGTGRLWWAARGFEDSLGTLEGCVMKALSKKSGFTLIELMIVVAIIAI
ncbi:MAG: type II secretion system protein, partial [Candidatus Hydrogenedentes bacterium]|nr:type II secretion system protein [Candidatus Hydrogenedentota bacterium]